MEAYIGQIIAVGFNFAPQGWLPCDGRLLPIQDYDALYALIGTTYGGDGASNFGLPDLRGRAAMNQGQKTGRSSYATGQSGGSESVTLSGANMPTHNHLMMASAKLGTTDTPAQGLALATNAQDAAFLYDAPPPAVTLSGQSIGSSPGGAAHENRQPSLTVNYIICTQGIYPPQG